MDGYSAVVLLFFGYVVGQITFFAVPYLPIAVLTGASAVTLAAVLLWHWTQFSVEYRLSTWQEGLRNYASYFLIFLVMLLSYGFYVFSRNGGSVAAVAQQAQSASRNALNRSSRAIAQVFQAAEPSPSSTMSIFGQNTNRNTNAGANAAKNAGGILPSFSFNASPKPAPTGF